MALMRKHGPRASALGVFMSGDVKIARQLIAKKMRMRAIEFAASESHPARLRELLDRLKPPCRCWSPARSGPA